MEMTNSPINFKAILIREPYAKKSEDWQDTAFAWRIWINDQNFFYFTGGGLVEKNGKPKKPSLDDVLYCLVNDALACEMSFEYWCSELGYETDSRKALQTYLDCQDIGHKLRKAGICIQTERDRLQDY